MKLQIVIIMLPFNITLNSHTWIHGILFYPNAEDAIKTSGCQMLTARIYSIDGGDRGANSDTVK